VRPHPGTSECANDRKRCEIAKGSVKFKNVIEEQENRRTRKEKIGCNKKTNNVSFAFGRHEQQPGRILETVNSDNNKV
jgi:hypothetical protein